VAFRKLWLTNPWDPRAILLFLKTNRLGHVICPFARWQHCWYAQTALCIRRTRTLCICRTLCRPVTIGTPMVLSVFDDWYSVPFVNKQSKTTKRQSKQQKWPLVYQSSHVYTAESAEYTKPRKLRYFARPPQCAWAVATAARRRPWAGLTACMCLHGRPCVCRLPFAAACCYTLFYTDDACSSFSLSTTASSNFPYFWTLLANFLLSHPNSVEYSNSKTTTFSLHCCPGLNVRVHSSKVELASCGGRPSGWHDRPIVTCQRLVIVNFVT